jgi:hypothetical protein
MTSLLSQLPLDAETLSRTPPEVSEFLLRLLAENQALREENQLLRQEIVVLRARDLRAKVTSSFLNNSIGKSTVKSCCNDCESNRYSKV